MGWPLAPSVEDRPRAARILRAIREVVLTDGLHHVPLDSEALARTFFGAIVRGERLGVPAFSLAWRMEVGSPMLWTSGQERRFLPASITPRVRTLIDALGPLLSGDELELDYTHGAAELLFPQSTSVFPAGWWSGWRDRNADGANMGEIYDERVHPAMVQALEDLPERASVVELGSGGGELLARAVRARPDLMFRAVEQCESEVRRFRVPGVAVEHCDARTWHGKADVVVACGLLNINVLRRDDALQLIRTLRPKRWIVGGWTPCLLNRKDWEDAGYSVRNTIRPVVEPGWHGQQLYVADLDATGLVGEPPPHKEG